jgi:steroid 5-alpha reductase family enzyme
MTLFTATTPFANCAIATFGFQFFGFLLAYAMQTETFYDIVGSGNFLLIGVWTFFSSSSPHATVSIVATVLFLGSRSWLLIFLGWRAHERKGDSRFDGVKDKAGMFLLFWMVQAIWVYLISLPTIYINSIFTINDRVSSSSQSLSVYNTVILVLFAGAIAIEIMADIQKAVWVRQGREGGFCTVGVWNYSRHPNYFGEILQWCCSFLLILPILLEHPSFYGWSCILSPIFTCLILLYAGGTGLTNAEGKGLKRYYENQNIIDNYKAYRANTSILVPMVGYASLPTWIKRTLLFEWKRYEYYTPSVNNKKDE